MIFRLTCTIFLTLLFASQARAIKLKPETSEAFDRYATLTEQRLNSELSSEAFLWIDALPQKQRDADYSSLHKGEVVTQRLETLDQGRTIFVPDGLVHHWIGVVFVPGALLVDMVGFLKDYDDQYRYYAPDVERSKLISRNGNNFKVYLRLRRKKVVTVVLNTEYDVHYMMIKNDCVAVRSYSTRISQVQNAWEKDELERPVGDDDGFMWRLNSYWRLLQRDGGVYVQTEAISLTRDIPTGLSWLVRPYVSSIPQESLAFTLGRTRQVWLAK
jgi:hypothetical protein